VKQVLYIPKRERKSDIHQHAKLDDLGCGFEEAKRILSRFLRLNAWICCLEPDSLGNTFLSSQHGELSAINHERTLQFWEFVGV
tara:strand:+ start:14739 stop:14990 length:252 start_codon:yes stop_codon:yes gene_type:complete